MYSTLLGLWCKKRHKFLQISSNYSGFFKTSGPNQKEIYEMTMWVLREDSKSSKAEQSGKLGLLRAADQWH